MLARLSVCTREEQRSVIRFLWAEGVKGAEIHARLCTQYGNNALPRRSVYEWIEMFENGRTSVMDAERSGRPSTSTTDEKLEEARAIILTDRRVTIEEIALQLGISQGTAYSLVHDILGFHKVAARWVPRHLTEEHKRNRQHICSSLLERYNREGDNFLNRIITGDETWVHHYEPETKRQSMQWKHTSSPSSKKFKSQPSAGKLLLTVFWDSQGPILEHYMEKGVTVTSVNYSNMLRNELRPAIRSKRRGRLTQGVLLLHDNARPHTAHLTINTIRQLNWEVLEHPAYSPDLAPSDFHLFGPLKNALRGRRFAADDEVKEAVHDWLRSQPQTFFSNGIKKLTDRWAKCIEKKGDYIEK